MKKPNLNLNARPLFIIVISILFFLCRHTGNKNSNDIAQLTTNINKNKDCIKETGELDADSIAFDGILQDALKLADKNISKNNFSKKYNVVSEADGSPIVEVEINLGYHFTKTLQHLVVRRKDPSTVYIDIFSKQNKKFKKVLSHEQWALEYTNDTIRNVNGDGYKDFIVNWYGSSGCCLKAFSNVYLLRADKQTFAKNLEFINPTFSPEEGIIRGVCYGQPGETEMYKYKWNGELTDTLEYVSYQIDDAGIKTGKVILSNGDSYSKKYKVIKVLNAVPQEYRKIGGYDWFTGNVVIKQKYKSPFRGFTLFTSYKEAATYCTLPQSLSVPRRSHNSRA
ncbi:hypothetical protein HYN59_12965 [Flavobacterium album]|uniref:Uncharacterized protein n=1 Tax=Flavobacterium album TaxID=2175091 RepID=A0A2S1QZW5_9FLAO|nr:hypothetical protein [Flavobacterium album]AWH85962.1 hypothetical protein HYN59_12965 [Flavobacterium album]